MTSFDQPTVAIMRPGPATIGFACRFGAWTFAQAMPGVGDEGPTGAEPLIAPDRRG